MRHRKKSERFSRSQSQRKALIKSLLRAVIINERITTTTSRAKYLKGEVDGLITWAKKGTLAGKRLAYSVLGDHKLVKKLFDEIGPRFSKVSGGYTRTLSVATRKGDGAPLSLIELTKMTKISKLRKGKDTESEGKDKLKEADLKKASPVVEAKPKKGFTSGVKKIFKKDKNVAQ
ncbi:MAG: 50S ribosomal protein L17 [Candidatus Susulua stagnicola]|nr:50S ribosomal protein L17 [Candidatus Susulua stagnicola]